MLNKYGKRARNFLERFNLFFKLLISIFLEGVFNETIIYLCLSDI